MTRGLLLSGALVVWASAALASGHRLGVPLSGELLSKYVRQFNADDDETYGNAIRNAQAEEFLLKNVPPFECPDADIERTYHFRWWTYRKHLRKAPDGRWLVTEFLPDVSWARTNNCIFCAMGHHVMEGRWLRDATPIKDYLDFWFRGAGRPHRTLYTSWPTYAAVEFAKTTGDMSFATGLYPELRDYYNMLEKGWWTGRFRLGRDGKGLFGVEDWREGSELSISGNGNRPLHNAVMWREAKCLAALAQAAGRPDEAKAFAEKAAETEKAVKGLLWNAKVEFFTTIMTNGVHADARELHGYGPWYVRMPLEGYGAAWKWVLPQTGGKAGFRARWGLTSADMGADGFGIEHVKGQDCKWNGPVWPFTSSIAISGLANALRAGEAGPATARDYVAILHEYAAAHVFARPDGKTVPWIDENQDPFNGEWLARAIHFSRGVTNERGKDYNHSTFCDLVISGLVGLVPRADDSLTVAPLFPKEWAYLALENVRYHGHDVSVRWDPTGTRYGRKGFLVLVDGKVAASARLPSRLDVTLSGVLGQSTPLRGVD